MSFSEFRELRTVGAVEAPEPKVSLSRETSFTLPVYECQNDNITAADWLIEHHTCAVAALTKHGAILLRGFDVGTPYQLEQAIVAVDGAPMNYLENTSPRSTLSGEIKTSTDHPADQTIEMHCEQSYSRIFPLHLFLACVQPANNGGETPIADTRRVLEAIPQDIRSMLGAKGYLYRRIFYPGLGPDWKETYLVSDEEALERHLQQAGVTWRWLEGGILQTDILRRSIGTHPLTGEVAWFSHLLFWHHSSLEPAVARELLEQFGPYALPNGVFYSDGSLICDAEIAAIRKAYRQNTYAHQWQAGDLLILDNLLAAHGRHSYQGPRQIMFGMAHPVDAAETNVNWVES